MADNAERHRRRSIRLKGYDYCQTGSYFLTAGTPDRACLCGEVVDGEMRLHHIGRMAWGVWHLLRNRFAGLELDAFVFMPNQGIIRIVGAGSPRPHVSKPGETGKTRTGGLTP